MRPQPPSQRTTVDGSKVVKTSKNKKNGTGYGKLPKGSLPFPPLL